MIINVKPELISYEKRIQSLCRTPFYNHPKGCPNYNKKQGCPPQPLIDKILDLNKDICIIYTIFPIGEFAEKMKQKHPEWSQRQCYNPRRWQPRARKEHKEEIERFLENHKDMVVEKCPEAYGVNITDLMKNMGITLNWKWPPDHNTNNITYLVSLAGNSVTTSK